MAGWALISPRRDVRSLGLLMAAASVFGVLVTANSGGYRYGISDQAFYIPAILQDLSPGLFPRDAMLLDSQSPLTLSDELIAFVSRTAGIDLPGLFFGGYLISVLLFTTGLLLIGDRLFRCRWTVAAFVLGLTIRHRITETGVNTFEGYFHPRVLAFALGLIAAGVFLRRRRALACVLTLAASIVHPTTGMWFSVWIGVAVAATWRYGWRMTAATGAGVVALAVWLLTRPPFAERMAVMDPAWTAALGGKDYLFPTAWPFEVWLINLLAPLVVLGLYHVRRSTGALSELERGLFLGCVALLGCFVASLPFIAARVALVVQLQTSRVLWPIEVLASAYLLWALIELPRSRSRASAGARGRTVVAVLAVASVIRGAYVLGFEQQRPLVSIDLPDTEWQQVADWAEDHTELDAHFLVDPGHAWKYGVNFRIAAERDVFLDLLKDTAMATYSRAVALRVQHRAAALGDFASLTAAKAATLAEAHDLDYLVTDRPLRLPLAYATKRFRVYSLGPD